MGKLSKRKGASFELLVVGLVRDTYDVDKSECFRTPGSGGHRDFSVKYPGDLYIGPDLHKQFPFVVECKHHKTWHAGAMLLNRVSEQKWLDQVTGDCDTAPQPSTPLLVMRGPSTPVYAAMPVSALRKLRKGKRRVPTYLVFTYKNKQWAMMEFKMLLALLTTGRPT